MLNNTELLVAEYGGTGRSGKGTIVAELARHRPGTAVEETGADYRAVTKWLLARGEIEHGMPDAIVRQRLANVATSQLVAVAADCRAIVAEHGLDSLYADDVSGLVADVGTLPSVREALKAGFRQRVERVRDSGEHDLLLVDGRNLAAAVRPIENTRLLLRTFVSCLPGEAARREALRRGLSLNDQAVVEIAESIRARNAKDANRQLDPARPDENAIHYWGDQDVWNVTAQAEVVKKYSEAVVTRLGAGALAVATGRQIHFDTTVFHHMYGKDSKDAMVTAAEQMLHEALESVGGANVAA